MSLAHVDCNPVKNLLFNSSLCAAFSSLWTLSDPTIAFIFTLLNSLLHRNITGVDHTVNARPSMQFRLNALIHLLCLHLQLLYRFLCTNQHRDIRNDFFKGHLCKFHSILFVQLFWLKSANPIVHQLVNHFRSSDFFIPQIFHLLHVLFWVQCKIPDHPNTSSFILQCQSCPKAVKCSISFRCLFGIAHRSIKELLAFLTQFQLTQILLILFCILRQEIPNCVHVPGLRLCLHVALDQMQLLPSLGTSVTSASSFAP